MAKFEVLTTDPDSTVFFDLEVFRHVTTHLVTDKPPADFGEENDFAFLPMAIHDERHPGDHVRPYTLWQKMNGAWEEQLGMQEEYDT